MTERLSPAKLDDCFQMEYHLHGIEVAFERLGLNVIDASDSWGIINHDAFLTNAGVRKVISRAIEAGGSNL